MRIIYRTIVVAMIFSLDGKLFQATKNPKDRGVYSDTDLWHIPGGGVEEKETEKEALIREVKEETGIDISQAEITTMDKSGTGEAEKTLRDTGERVLCKMKFITFKAQLVSNSKVIQVALNTELSKYRWSDLSELKNLKLTPPSEELFKKLGYI